MLLDAPRLEASFTQNLKRPTDFVNAFLPFRSPPRWYLLCVIPSATATSFPIFARYINVVPPLYEFRSLSFNSLLSFLNVSLPSY